MKHSDFRIGQSFSCGDKMWQCTDVGTRTIVAIELRTDNVHNAGCSLMGVPFPISSCVCGWNAGPPYAVAEIVFDENDFEGCEP